MPDGALTIDDLVDAEFLASLARLHVVARRVDPGGRFADQRSRDVGSGIEFKDHPVRQHELWFPGRASEQARRELKALGWSLFENSYKQLKTF